MEPAEKQPATAHHSPDPSARCLEPHTLHSTPHTLSYSPWLHRFAIAFVLATFILILLGGTVTSKGAGLAVPDWPGTFHYNMFLFPPSMWVGGIFWEHTHRLMGSLVGMMAIVLAIWLRQTERGPTTPVHVSRPWLAHFGMATLLMVIIQGIMGGLRVTQLSTWLAVFHGITAQIVFCMTILIAAATSRWWVERERHEGTEARPRVRHEGTERKGHEEKANPKSQISNLKSNFSNPLSDIRHPQSEIPNPKSLLPVATFALIVLFIQLALGATVRHHGAGLAIPDFPLSYGQIVPPLSQSGIEKAMIQYADDPDSYATSVHGWYSPFHVAIHWSHRLWAIVVIIALDRLIKRVMRSAGSEMKLKFPAGAIGIMLLLQIALGASIIWTGRHPEVATAHQTLGAILLATTALLYYRIRLLALHPSRDRQEADAASPFALSSATNSNRSLTVAAQTELPLHTQGAST